MTIAGIATVLITRAYLAATGYPKVGGGTIHIGHVLWGGLLMIAALTVALVWVGKRARNWTALLGGVGVGLFVDEGGKYLTTTNDYFYRPAAAIIYLLFAALLVLASLLGRDTAAEATDPADRLALAAQTAATALISGLTHDERDRALRLLDGCAGADRDAVVHLLSLAPPHEPGRWVRLGTRIRRLADHVAWLRFAEAVVFTLLVLSHVVVAVVFIVQATTGEPHTTDAGAVAASAVTRTAAALVVLTAVRLLLRTRRVAAYRLARAAVLLDLLVTEIFNFHDSQFGALAELPWLLAAFMFLTVRQPQE
ncbi:MAG: hypothetical protein AUG49_07150 [Catenulispora sp. 13_1_20CM_3_70_7]|nr:MAG: hypothetical protein AUG49_07150 [Catenulispora sp. 13_1_20CM_3_70_7]